MYIKTGLYAVSVSYDLCNDGHIIYIIITFNLCNICLRTNSPLVALVRDQGT